MLCRCDDDDDDEDEEDDECRVAVVVDCEYGRDLEPFRDDFPLPYRFLLLPPCFFEAEEDEAEAEAEAEEEEEVSDE